MMKMEMIRLMLVVRRSNCSKILIIRCRLEESGRGRRKTPLQQPSAVGAIQQEPPLPLCHVRHRSLHPRRQPGSFARADSQMTQCHTGHHKC